MDSYSDNVASREGEGEGGGDEGVPTRKLTNGISSRKPPGQSKKAWGGGGGGGNERSPPHSKSSQADTVKVAWSQNLSPER